MFNINLKKNKGVSLYLSLIIMAIFLAIALGLTTLLIGQLGIIKGMGDSVVAFYAADTGIEKILTRRSSLPLPGDPFLSGTLPNLATYEITITASGTAGCTAFYCIKSIGTFRNTKRAIEITY